MNALLTAAVSAAMTTVALAQPTTLSLDAGSSISVTGTLHTPIGSQTDSDSSPISGTITIELDSYGTPTAITLHDFNMLVVQSIDLNYDWGFLGSVDITVGNASASYGGTTPAGPVAVNPDSTFYFPSILTNINGSGSATGSIFLFGDINETVNLADFNPFATDFAGSVGVNGDTVTLAGTIDFAGSGEVVTGITMDLSGTLTLAASGPAPQPCVPDWNADGALDFFDVLGFLSAFTSNEPAADLNNDGILDFFDVLDFLSLFAAGCP
ncbi:MAG: hypothetical protein D6695_09580 [Planctomycetota bacterium]|nr:MAG: hypothetical protein D6695_09580 [Planctomycetota bacterium]